MPEIEYLDTPYDTEVLLQLWSLKGVDCIALLDGFFAFAIWDTELKELTLARDKTGVKPLYYYWNDGIFLFSSELKAFHVHPQFKKLIDENAVSQFMDFGYVPAPYCIFRH